MCPYVDRLVVNSKHTVRTFPPTSRAAISAQHELAGRTLDRTFCSILQLILTLEILGELTLRVHTRYHVLTH